jgi:flagellar FliJ protein
MKRFRFPLRPVAVIRAHKELRAREAFAASVHAYVQAEEKLAATRARVAELAQVLFDGRGGTFLAAEAAALFRAYRAECDEQLKVEREVIEARDHMEKRRAEYLDASRQLKVVNKLEDKARTLHRAAAMVEDQAAMDDFAGFRAARRAILT